MTREIRLLTSTLLAVAAAWFILRLPTPGVDPAIMTQVTGQAPGAVEAALPYFVAAVVGAVLFAASFAVTGWTLSPQRRA